MSYDQIRRVSVHIPPCENPECRSSLDRLAVLLQNEYCTCFNEYKLNGPYCKWFEEILSEATFTILHKCLQFWNKIESCSSLLECPANKGKIICVDLGYDASLNNDPSTSLQAFFKEYTVPLIISDDDFTSFISKVKSCLDEKLTKRDVQESTSCVVSGQYSASDTSFDKKEQRYYNFASKDDTDIIRIFEDCPCKNESVYSEDDIDEPLKHFPDMFGKLNTSDLLVSNSCFSISAGHTCFKFSSVVSDGSAAMQIQRYINSFKHNEETLLTNCTHCLQRVLPALYLHQSHLGLLIVALCDLPILQDRALSLLEVLLLMCPIKQSSLTHNMKTMLKENLLKRHSNVKQKELQMITRRLANVYMMIQCEMITSCPGQQPVSCCHLREGSSSADVGDSYWCSLDTFQKKGEREICQCDCAQQVLAHVISAHDVIPKVNDILKEKLSTQLAVVFGCLRKIFNTNDKATVTYLKKFVSLKAGKKEMHAMCTTMILHGFIHFLSHGLKSSMHKDIKDLCFEVMSVIKILSKKDLQEGDSGMLQMLLFDRTPAIRQGIILSFIEKNVYSNCIQLLLLNEVRRLLLPLFPSHGKPEKKSSEDQWLMVPGRFDGKNAIAFIHEPTEEIHFHMIKTKFTAKEDLVHVRQAKILQKLQHQNIATIFAYRLSRIPQFYIIEECMENNLQIALKNRRENNNMLTQSTLIYYLADIASALRYCHEMNIVHRNLTAASVFIVGENTAKLCDFTLALELGDKETVYIEDNLLLPTRWTSPESLRDCAFSRSSDVWMFSHLMYEVLTHGLLPYSQFNMADTELVLHIITGSVSLSQECEPCIKENHLATIQQCIDLNPSKRLSSKELQQIMESHRNSVVTEKRIKTRYPDLTLGFRTSSSKLKKAIPGVKVSGGNNSCPNLRALKSLETPHIVSQYYVIEEHQFIFREEVQRHFQKDMVQMLHEGHLNSIIPHTKFYIFSESKESHFIDCFTPAHEKCSLKITQVISDGETPLEVCLLGLSFLIQVADLLETLHNNAFVLGDFTNLNFCMDNNMQVHLISVAFLSHINKDTSTSTVNRKKTKSWVVKPVSFQHDLFCFGKMMLSILQLEKFCHSLSVGLAGKDPILVDIKQNLNDTAVQCARIQTNLNEVSMNLRQHLQTISTKYLQDKNYGGNISKILKVTMKITEHSSKDGELSKSFPERKPKWTSHQPAKVPETPYVFSQPPHLQPSKPPRPPSEPPPPPPPIQPALPPPLPPRGFPKQIQAVQPNKRPQILPRSKSLEQLLTTNELRVFPLPGDKSTKQIPIPKPRKTILNNSLMRPHTKLFPFSESPTSIYEKDQTSQVCQNEVYPDVDHSVVSHLNKHRVSCASSVSDLSSGSDWLRRTTYDLTRSPQIPMLGLGLTGVYTTSVVLPNVDSAFGELGSPMLSSDDSTLLDSNCHIFEDETKVWWV